MKNLLMTCLTALLFLIIGIGSAFADSDAPEGADAPHLERKGGGFKERRHHRQKKMTKRLIKKIDTNEDGKVDLTEYLAHTQERFIRMDINADGFITPEEMRETHKLIREEHRQAARAAREQKTVSEQ